jgi:uncharacterized Rossmann fold enzyme
MSNIRWLRKNRKIIESKFDLQTDVESARHMTLVISDAQKSRSVVLSSTPSSRRVYVMRNADVARVLRRDFGKNCKTSDFCIDYL